MADKLLVDRELLQDLRDLAFDAVEQHRQAMGGYRAGRQARMDSVIAQADAVFGDPVTPTDGEAVEVVAYAVAHPEAGYKIYKQFSQWMADWQPQPLMTVAQHERLMAEKDARIAVLELALQADK
jgi:hypothetical protein